MADKHWIRDLNGVPVIVLAFVGATHVHVRVGTNNIDTETWSIDFWRSLPYA